MLTEQGIKHLKDIDSQKYSINIQIKRRFTIKQLWILLRMHYRGKMLLYSLME